MLQWACQWVACELFQLLETLINYATLYSWQKTADLPIVGSYNLITFETCESTDIEHTNKITLHLGYFHK